ncbi:NAD-dependent epimerase/dehydratase family protein [Pedobacter faecalis]|uniref:NAD-dependent epimerase/dehydratase family protein n=1 Tax=Pedobacter faecalis TaxID=3041495 RepID=UPI00254D79D0|nr:NAD-dependent epimerase/dehydratase family protein [Pedobacter sp. ELA7]
MVTVHLTGANGFVGTNLKRFLNQSIKYETYTIGRQQLYESPFVFGEDCETIVHLAGKAHDLKDTSDAEEYEQVNYELTKMLFDSFLNSNARKFIFVSSVKAVSDAPDSVLSETDLPNPKTPYGKSKLLAEQYIQSCSLPSDKQFFILRPCMIHGPGNKGNLTQLYQVVKRGIPYPLAAYNNQRSFLSIENFCFIIQELIDRGDIPSGIYNIADDSPLSTVEVIEILGEATAKRSRLLHISPKLIQGLAMIGDVLKLPLTTERLAKLTESYIVSNEKIKRAIGKELPVTAREGLLRTAKSFSSCSL